MRTPKAATFYLGLVFGIGFALGLIRVPLVVPHLGVRLSEPLEMALMFAAIVWAARLLEGKSLGAYVTGRDPGRLAVAIRFDSPGRDR